MLSHISHNDVGSGDMAQWVRHFPQSMKEVSSDTQSQCKYSTAIVTVVTTLFAWEI